MLACQVQNFISTPVFIDLKDGQRITGLIEL